MGHPLEDVALIAVSVFALNALKAGASLPVAMVAGCLELLVKFAKKKWRLNKFAV